MTTVSYLIFHFKNKNIYFLLNKCKGYLFMSRFYSLMNKIIVLIIIIVKAALKVFIYNKKTTTNKSFFFFIFLTQGLLVATIFCFFNSEVSRFSNLFKLN